jgi:hypothetical protein
MIAAAIVGCGSGLKSKIVGVWKFDPSTMVSPVLDKLRAADPKMADQIDRNTAAARFEFKEDGTLKMSNTMTTTSVAGTWRLEGDKITVTIANVPPEQTPGFTVDSSGSKLHMNQGGPTGGEADLVRS